MFKEYSQFDGIGLAELIQQKEVSPSEVVDAAIQQIEKYNPQVNAVVYKMYEQAKREAVKDLVSAPFAGVPFLIKDLGIDFAGTPTSSGSLLTKNAMALEDSEIMQRYKQSGFITLGKTSTPEFGIMGVTEPLLWGRCRNPWNLGLTAGGSSGGSAAAVAARMVPIASADDGGGSIRIPASACGLFGFKPSRGLQPQGPRKNEGWLSLVSGHVVSRTVRDSAMVLDLTKGPASGAPYGPTLGIPHLTESLQQSIKGKRIAFSKQSLFGEQVDADCVDALMETMKVCEGFGLHVVEDQPKFNKQELVFSYYVIVASSVAGEVARIEKRLGTKASLANVEPATWFLKVTGEKLRAAHLEQAIYVARQATMLWENFLSQYDYFSTPTMAYAPSPIGLMSISAVEKAAVHLADYLPLSVVLSTLKQIGARGIEKTPNTSMFNMSGHPAMSVPSYWNSQQIPIGVQFVGRMGQDQHLFSLASALEKHFAWEKRAPVV